MLVLLSLLTACAPCRPLDDVRFSNPDAALSIGERDVIEGAIAAFRDWSGRDALCVDTVRFEEELTHRGEEVWGMYSSLTGTVSVSEQSYLFETTIHELCHALDAQERIQPRWPEVFPPDLVERSNLYRSDANRAGEGLARACEGGPPHLSAQVAEIACGVPTLDDIDLVLLAEA